MDPLNYSRYENKCESCYYASLWALLHVPSNPLVKELVEWSKTNGDEKSTNLLKYILQYYKNIHTPTDVNSNKKFALDLINFRRFLENNYSDGNKDWRRGQKDTSDPINTISRVFEIEYQVNPIESNDELSYFTSNPSGILFDLNYWYDNKNKLLIARSVNIGENPIFLGSILPKIFIPITVPNIIYENDNLIVSGKKEKSEVQKLVIDDNTYNPPLYLIEKQIIHKPKFFSIYLNRSVSDPKIVQIYKNNLQIDGNLRFKDINGERTGPYYLNEDKLLPPNKNIKDKTPHNIIDSYGPLELYSIVVHSGGAEGGHYTCYFKNTGTWYLFNDIGHSIEKVSDPTKDQKVLSNWNFLVYFNPNYFDNQIDKEIKQEIYEPDNTIEEESNGFFSNYFTNSQIQSEYNIKPATMVILSGLIGWILHSELNKTPGQEQDDMVYIVGILAAIISELIAPDEPIETTVKRFINSFMGLVIDSSSSKKGGSKQLSGGFDIRANVQQLIHHITQILKAWVNSNKTVPISQIVEEYKTIILNPINQLIKEIELATQTKSIQMAINILNSTINSTNYKIFVNADPEQQIKILRGLGWKVSVCQTGKSKLISWDQWVNLGPDLLVQIKKTVPTPILRYLIETYINKVNLTKQFV